jgi:type II secretory pathway pseudopilin PulG
MKSARSRRFGFTLVETMFAVVTLGLFASGIAALYLAGSSALVAEREFIQTESMLRSEMERVVSTPFAQLTNRTEVVTAGVSIYTSVWSVTYADLDGDLVPEVDAKWVKVGVRDRSLAVLQVDHKGLVGKL